MESLSRPPHRRKHSASTNVFSTSVSFKNPYDGVLLSNGGERKSLEAHEYSEIFSGSSSIPVLDLPGLDERVGSGDSRDSKLDYSNIFGGFANDDVFVPYEELLNDSAKKTKPRMPAESQPHPQESGSRHPSRKTKRSSGEVSDQSVDGVKKQINISFNKTNQRNGDASEGKTHVAQLHAVPAFTHFIDGTPRPDKTKGSQVPLLKREVSRTWSFSAEMGPVSDKGGSNSWTSQTKDTSHNANEVNIKSQFTKMPPPSSFPSNLSGDKDPRQSPPSNFSSKSDASRKMAGECSPPFFGEEFDENSVDAVSAAALKKAIEQAQESIRIAKMIMERKKESCQDGSKPQPIGSLKVSKAEAKIDREAYISKGNKAKGKHEEPDHVVNVIAGIDRKFTPSSSHSSTVSRAANSVVERVSENVEADKEHGETFSGKSKLFVSTSGHLERLNNNGNVKLEKLEKNVEATETQREAKDFPGSVANAVCGTVELEPVKLRNSNGLMPGKLATDFGELGTEKEMLERRNITIHHTEISEVIPGIGERSADTSERMQGKGKIVDEDELCRATLDHAEGSENMVERVPSTLQRSTGHYMVVDDAGDNLSSSQERDVSKQRENDMIHKKKIWELEEFLDESCNQVGNESLKQEEMKKRTENDCNEEISGTRKNEAHICFESKDKMKESFPEEINKREHHTAPEIGEFEKKGNKACKLEINDKKQDLADDNGDEAKLAEVLSQNKVEEQQVSICEYEADGTIMMEANLSAEVQKEAFSDTNETVNALGGARRSEGSDRKCEFQEAAYEEDIDEAVEASSCDARTIFDDAHTKDDSTVIQETREACNADLNSKVEHSKTAKNCEENETMPEVDETVSAVDQEKKAEQLFHLHDNEILGTKSLHRSASEEIFVDNKLEKAFEGLSSAGKMETVGVVDADSEENLLKDENVCNTTGDNHDAAQENATKINRQNLPEELACDIRMAEFNFTDVRQVSEQTSESDDGSLSVSGSEKVEESDEFTEKVKDLTSEKEEPEDQPKTISDERKCAEDLSEFSELHSEPKEMDKPKNTDRDEEKGFNPKTKENLVGASPRERDAKESGHDINDQKQRIEAIKRGREREKDRLVVERAIREARERAFADARERAERAAVEKAAAEARQRIMAEAKEKAEKATTEAKLRAERAAVERATAEARERALEKAMSQKVSTERVSSSTRSNGLKHSFSSSDLENGMNTESAQRRKARLERHQRIMERAAKALAEKNMRDLLVQKEQAERNRLAESLDADIKRWASGKEGNLRALLSTLQYILGPDSGWQPISLTEIITTVAVKKAYRKATLYVHPDKLQQRGASVQQKYVCEKVFDLLKAAWNRFNSDER